MIEIKNLENCISDSITEVNISFITDRLKKVNDSLCHTSKEKYDLKAKLIKEADDMTSKEKLDALDQNYDRHNQEVWQNIIIFGVVSITLIEIAVRNLSIVKKVHRFVI